ncbi:aspartate aminotransferase family protein [Leptospira sp. GIMC2001]|uniref:aspartate aminotransferase family protein n=1 Tax=Leptospira sp. GIMC2001 TaxID=1513297 RepID=UPI00234BCFAA|nr:aspartate aminotransferase family protein [Leptospira sp. GIMC2001]WCL48634.1 aspartate aminotransferase family protein [Leptospira sp. GIMC2001]
MNLTELSFKEVKDLTEKYIIDTYNRYPIGFRYGVGETLFDLNDKPYIDFQCGISVTNLGHGEADIIETLRNQADKLFHTSNLYYSEQQAKLAETIINHSFPGKVFFCNSGTEANEAAFKLMRKHAHQSSINDPVILALKGSFHGRTTSSMSMTGQKSIREGFGDLVPGVHFVTENDEDSLVDAFEQYGDRIAGIIMEPILGEGGIHPLSVSFVETARKLTHETGALLIFDEIQTGMGRTGKMFCFEHFGFAPDAFTLAKALGSGFPIGALIVSDEHSTILGRGDHGSTFGGNHLACAIAYETFRVIQSRDILTNVETTAEYCIQRLQSIGQKNKLIKDIRGRGLHIGVELTIPSRQVAEKCLINGLVINATANTVLRIMPPINITQEKMEEGLDILEKTLEEFK